MDRIKELLEKLNSNKTLEIFEYTKILDGLNEENTEYAKQLAVANRKRVYGHAVYIRGLIEISNYCKNGCLYCGINRDNKKCLRYRLTEDEILSCCENGYRLGFRTFVMQGGEDNHFTDDVLCGIVSKIKAKYPDCAVTLSVGERSFDSYKRLYDAGADRYLLRHETADSDHYSRLHPGDLTLENRLECLKNLKKIGFQVGCGLMVGSPYQTNSHLAKDLKFIEEFEPEMCGIGPFLPHRDTVFCDKPKGSFDMTLYLLSIIRIMKPSILLPSTTALGTIRDGGREMGILAGANVIMPNLSPEVAKEKYMLYDNKLSTGAESANGILALKENMEKIGYEIVTSRGDYKNI